MLRRLDRKLGRERREQLQRKLREALARIRQGMHRRGHHRRGHERGAEGGGAEGGHPHGDDPQRHSQPHRHWHLIAKERERLRSRAIELRKKLNAHDDRQRSRWKEHVRQLSRLDPREKKRYLALRKILRQLPPEEHQRLQGLPPEELKKHTRELLLERGGRAFEAQIERLTPTIAGEVRARPEGERRALFRRWLNDPTPSLPEFLRSEGLLRGELAPPSPPGERKRTRRGKPRGVAPRAPENVPEDPDEQRHPSEREPKDESPAERQREDSEQGLEEGDLDDRVWIPRDLDQRGGGAPTRDAQVGHDRAIPPPDLSSQDLSRTAMPRSEP